MDFELVKYKEDYSVAPPDFGKFPLIGKPMVGFIFSSKERYLLAKEGRFNKISPAIVVSEGEIGENVKCPPYELILEKKCPKRQWSFRFS